MTNAEEMAMKTVHDLGAAVVSDVCNYTGLSPIEAGWALDALYRKGYLKVVSTEYECDTNEHGERRIIEPQPDGIQFRTVDDLGRICIPKDIRDKLGIKPGTECAVYATDELTPEQIIVIRRKKNGKTN